MHVLSDLVPTLTKSPKLVELIRTKLYDYGGSYLYYQLKDSLCVK
jgi:hypothetical protein